LQGSRALRWTIGVGVAGGWRGGFFPKPNPPHSVSHNNCDKLRRAEMAISCMVCMSLASSSRSDLRSSTSGAADFFATTCFFFVAIAAFQRRIKIKLIIL